MQLINLTPHRLVIRTEAGEDIIIEPSGNVARVATLPQESLDGHGLPFAVLGPTRFGAVEGIPDPKPGVGYIVSGLVAAHASRFDVFAPGTAPAHKPVRDANGRITAVRLLVRSA